MVSKLTRVCLVPRLEGVGGMVSFQRKIARGLQAGGIEVCTDLDDTPYQAVLVIGGTRNLTGLRKARRNGARIVQRLDGMNWLHRRLRTGVRHYLRAEIGNWLLAYIRSHLADFIVYQSQFSREWWERVRGPVPAANRVIYNGVDLTQYFPGEGQDPPVDRWRVLLVEGSLLGGYEAGLEVAVKLVEGLEGRIHLGQSTSQSTHQAVELMVVGRVSEQTQQRWQQQTQISIRWAGQVPHEHIPEIDQTGHILYSADLNAACPNSVIEALACGLPVLAFDTGALPELVSPSAGRVVPYGGNPWLLEPPDMVGLVGAAAEILQDQAAYRTGARRRAEEAFDVEHMVQRYVQVLQGIDLS